MSIFKKSAAVAIEKMDVLNKVYITEDKVTFQLNYSNIDVDLKQVPKLLSDVMQLYSIAKPLLDKQSEELNKEKAKEEADTTDKVEPIDLSDIPF